MGEENFRKHEEYWPGTELVAHCAEDRLQASDRIFTIVMEFTEINIAEKNDVFAIEDRQDA